MFSYTNLIPGDVLEWITWGGGGLGDPLTRPPTIVAQEVHRRLVTVSGAAKNYGVVVRPADFSVNEGATTELREKMKADRAKTIDMEGYNRGGTIRELMAKCEEETGLKPPRPQWQKDPYGPHVGLEYVKNWYKRMREEGMELWDKA
jgi:5-oxoprolinase (ATP-hydrolysing)